MRKEDKLIRVLSGTRILTRRLEEAERLVASTLDWPYIVDASQREGVACLLYLNLKSLNLRGDAATEALGGFENIYYSAAARNTDILERAKEAVEALCSKGVRSMILKGPVLADRLYHNISLRPSADIDILVPREEFYAAHEALIKLGYTAPGSCGDFLPVPAISSLNSLAYELRGKTASLVHLHWHIINSTWPIERIANRIDMRRIWDRAEKTKLDGRDAMTLSPEHLLIYLCHHGLHHYFSRLILACDVSEAVKEYGSHLEWPALMAEAGSFGLELTVYCALKTVAAMLGVDTMNDKARTALSDSERNFTMLFSWRERSRISSFCAYLFNEPGVARKLRFLARLAVPTKLVMAQNFSIRASDVKLPHHLRRFSDFLIRCGQNGRRG